MDKMREEFEVFMANPHWSWATGDMKEEFYCLWKASRAALCVELPEPECGGDGSYYEDGLARGHNELLAVVVEKLKEAGVSQK